MSDSPAKPERPKARMDYHSACLVAIGACLLYFGQGVSRIQLADAFESSVKVRSSFVGYVMAIIVGLIVSAAWGTRRFSRRLYWILGLAPIPLAPMLFLVAVGINQPVNWSFLLLGTVFGAVFMVLFKFILNVAHRFGGRPLPKGP